MSFVNEINDYLEMLKKVIDNLDRNEIDRTMQAIVEKYHEEAAVYIFGNGGSAATASHFVCDFNKGACMNAKKKFRFQCLNDNVPIMTAISNDISYDDVFSFQLQNLAKPEDLVIAVSGSGNSRNIVKALEAAKQIGCAIIGITGFDGGIVKQLADYNLHVNIDDMQKVEDIHMVFDHLIMKILCESLADN